jgi:hypothetical protein
LIKLTLDELKTITIEHMKKELDIMEMMLTINVNDTKEFYKWYINHPYCRGIREIQELVKRGKRN